jgi:alkanesulfonate monooxygenase SsuD/methylene tetrahydromethanopterin reductase-like flavin-dependent oxidoreductase (luciferase family)
MLWLDGKPQRARSSVMIIDPDGKEPVVVTGSYDFGPTGAARNADNVIVLSGQRALAKAYMDNWKRHRTQSVSFADAVRATMGDDPRTPEHHERSVLRRAGAAAFARQHPT